MFAVVKYSIDLSSVMNSYRSKTRVTRLTTRKQNGFDGTALVGSIWLNTSVFLNQVALLSFEAVSQRTANAMAKRERSKRQTIVDKTPYRRLDIARHKLRKNPSALEGEQFMMIPNDAKCSRCSVIDKLSTVNDDMSVGFVFLH
jgi:hypothetical protein